MVLEPIGNQEIKYREITPAEWVNKLIESAAASGASDIHIEGLRSEVVARFRIDGRLHLVDRLHPGYLQTVISRLKVLAQLDVAEHRSPQDGHILFTPTMMPGVEPIDIRISLFPTILGEAAVLRILNRKDLMFDDFLKLGMREDIALRAQEVTKRPHGMILVTGPSGSGKTTTLYTILNTLRAEQKNVMTLEDPVELHLDYVRQGQVDPDVEFSFAQGLRAILRQDPDVIMIGEIRDDETASMSIRAALMGRLLFSTMHTNDSVGAVMRFLELGIPRSFIASALVMILAQRLVRLICLHCKTEADVSQETLTQAGLTSEQARGLRFGKGCERCHGMGYSGRAAIYEVLFVDDELERLILENASFAEIHAHTKKQKMQTLREAAIVKALSGDTTLEEALHVTAF